MRTLLANLIIALLALAFYWITAPWRCGWSRQWPDASRERRDPADTGGCRPAPDEAGGEPDRHRETRE